LQKIQNILYNLQQDIYKLFNYLEEQKRSSILKKNVVQEVYFDRIRNKQLSNNNNNISTIYKYNKDLLRTKL